MIISVMIIYIRYDNLLIFINVLCKIWSRKRQSAIMQKKVNPFLFLCTQSEGCNFIVLQREGVNTIHLFLQYIIIEKALTLLIYVYNMTFSFRVICFLLIINLASFIFNISFLGELNIPLLLLTIIMSLSLIGFLLSRVPHMYTR